MTYKNKVTFLTVLVGVLALGYAATLVFDPERVNVRDAAFAWLDGKALVQVSAVEIRRAAAQDVVNLVKKDGVWFVESGGRVYPAKQARVEDLLKLLAKKDAYPVRGREGASLERLGLSEGQADRLVLRGGAQENTVFLDLFVGSEDVTGAVYLRKNGRNEARSGADSLRLYVSGGKTAWYDLRLFPESERFPLDSVQAAVIALPADAPGAAQERIRLARTGDGWSVDGEKADSVKAESFLRGVLDAEGEDFSAESADAAAGGAAPGSVVLELGNGTVRTIRAGRLLDGDKRLLSVAGPAANADYVYVLSKWTLDCLFKSADSFK